MGIFELSFCSNSSRWLMAGFLLLKMVIMLCAQSFDKCSFLPILIAGGGEAIFLKSILITPVNS